MCSLVNWVDKHNQVLYSRMVWCESPVPRETPCKNTENTKRKTITQDVNTMPQMSA